MTRSHRIRLERKMFGPDIAKVIATVECKRRSCTLEVEECAYCERFERIETHEAGYSMLCRSSDEDPE